MGAQKQAQICNWKSQNSSYQEVTGSQQACIQEWHFLGGSVLEAEGVNDIPPISRFGRNGKEHRDSACSCLWIHSKFIRRGPCWWDGRWELALLCRQCLHKPTADFEFENTSTESEHARKHARTQKSRTARSTGSTKHESIESTNRSKDRKHRTQKA